jgi:hypothetical protein
MVVSHLQLGVAGVAVASVTVAGMIVGTHHGTR